MIASDFSASEASLVFVSDEQPGIRRRKAGSGFSYRTRTIEGVAAQLGNTTAVCRRCYVHPAVVDRFLAGDLRDQWSKIPSSPKRDLRAGERRLLTLLRPRPSGRAAA